MATDEQRATRSRGRGSIAAKPPRVVTAKTNMQEAADAIVAEATVAALRIFDHIPEHWHGVIPVDGNAAAPLLRKGEVAVFEKYEPHIHGDLIDGGLYVIEYQSTPAGASRSQWVKWFIEYRSRLQIDRRIVRVRQSKKNPGSWYTTPIAGPPTFLGIQGIVCSDGPYEQFDLWQKLIGIVVGIYRGDTQIGGAA